MKEFENINTSLPYAEDKVYVEALVERCRTAAKAPASRRSFLPWAMGIAASVAIAAVALGLLRREPESPMDSFLSGISDNEAAMIAYVQIEDIPEFYYDNL